MKYVNILPKPAMFVLTLSYHFRVERSPLNTRGHFKLSGNFQIIVGICITMAAPLNVPFVVGQLCVVFRVL